MHRRIKGEYVFGKHLFYGNHGRLVLGMMNLDFLVQGFPCNSFLICSVEFTLYCFSAYIDENTLLIFNSEKEYDERKESISGPVAVIGGLSCVDADLQVRCGEGCDSFDGAWA